MASARQWTSPEFEAELREWVEGVLGPVRLECHKVRPWSTVWKAYDGTRLWWAKQNCPANMFEGPLLEAAGTWLPGRFVPLEAADHEHGFTLMPDQGETLGSENADPETWQRLVRAWAQTQRLLVDHVDRMVAAGVSVLPPDGIVDLVRERADLLVALPEHDPRWLRDDVHASIVATLPLLRHSAAVLHDLDLPLTLVHNDLHGGNVFRGSGRVFDLGDALVSQPMADLLVPLGVLVEVTGCVVADPSLWRLAEAWVEVWSDVRPAGELREGLPHAMRLARVLRHEAWFRVTEDLEPEDLDDFGAEGAEWLGALSRRPLLAAT
jgi:hypothetical protein